MAREESLACERLLYLLFVLSGTKRVHQDQGFHLILSQFDWLIGRKSVGASD
jgi:hypothetical protein